MPTLKRSSGGDARWGFDADLSVVRTAWVEKKVEAKRNAESEGWRASAAFAFSESPDTLNGNPRRFA
jgi:hypothetical protein